MFQKFRRFIYCFIFSQLEPNSNTKKIASINCENIKVKKYTVEVLTKRNWIIWAPHLIHNLVKTKPNKLYPQKIVGTRAVPLRYFTEG